ncbi:MAG: hypothetical protein ACRD4F_02225 [Candidatus Angelobacter sp.]
MNLSDPLGLSTITYCSDEETFVNWDEEGNEIEQDICMAWDTAFIPDPPDPNRGGGNAGGGSAPNPPTPKKQPEKQPQQPQQPQPEPKPGWCTALVHAGNTTVALGGVVFLWGTLAAAGEVTAPAGIVSQASGGIGMAVGGIGIGIGDAGQALGICH